MNQLPTCILCTHDAALAARMEGYLRQIARVRRAQSPADSELACRQLGPALLLLDLRWGRAREVLDRILGSVPDTLVIALADPRSDPGLDASSRGAYAIESPDVDRLRLQSVVVQAQAHLRLLRENQLLKAQPGRAAPETAEPPALPPAGGASGLVMLRLHHFAQALRQFHNVEGMLESLVEVVADGARVFRVGVFATTRGSSTYRLRAGIKCLEETRGMTVSEEDPLIGWLRRQGCLVARSTLIHVADAGERIVLQQALDMLGAEAIVPLCGRERLIGWLFVGRRLTGAPLGASDLEDLVRLAEPLSMTLENALLHEEMAVQKTLAETVLQSIPVGIVACDADGAVKTLNQTASVMLGMEAADRLNMGLSDLDSRVEDLLGRCLSGRPREDPAEWTDAASQRSFSAVASRLGDERQCLGAVAIIRDLTREKESAEKQGQAERASFWAEMAAAMSHEIRNPLVAINTFAQLLPERYADAEFRNEFRELVTKEIARLNGMIDQINEFANPPRLSFGVLDIEQVLKRAVERAMRDVPPNGIRILTSVDKGPHLVRGDANALAECFAHLVVNAMEALHGRSDAVAQISAARRPDGDRDCVRVDVKDNGEGIPPGIRNRVFSPFCSMKARGLGLGLPIAQRTVLDHRGRLSIETSEHGTQVTVMLPLAEPDEPESNHEARSGRG